MTISSFNTTLKSEQDENPLLQLLRQLAIIPDPKDVRDLTTGGIAGGWR
jgi:hypothetical protein